MFLVCSGFHRFVFAYHTFFVIFSDLNLNLPQFFGYGNFPCGKYALGRSDNKRCFCILIQQCNSLNSAFDMDNHPIQINILPF